jgi:hypothetical protein
MPLNPMDVPTDSRTMSIPFVYPHRAGWRTRLALAAGLSAGIKRLSLRDGIVLPAGKLVSQGIRNGWADYACESRTDQTTYNSSRNIPDRSSHFCTRCCSRAERTQSEGISGHDRRVPYIDVQIGVFLRHICWVLR